VAIERPGVGRAPAPPDDDPIPLGDQILDGEAHITAAGSGVVLAMFRETGAARFLAGPLHELSGRTLALDALVPRGELAALQERIVDAPDHRRRIACLEQFLLARLRPEPADPLAAAAVAAIQRTHGVLRIAALAHELGISQDPLEKRFRRIVGGSPKQLASILRVRRAIQLGRAGATWSTVACQAGYFDQSHFIREFRAIAGMPPTRFFRDVEHC